MKIALTLFFALFLISHTMAWSQGIEENLQFLQQNTETVKDKKTEYQQTFSHDPGNNLLLTVAIVDARKGEERTQSVNALDLNPFLIKFKPVKELVEITAKVNGSKELVKIVEDGEVQSYDDEMVFYASGIEQARKLTDALKAVAEYAKENAAEVVAVSNSKQALLEDLTAGITDVSLNDETYAQSFKYDPGNNNIVTFELSDAGGGKVEQFTVNAADLNAHKIDFMTKRDQVLLPLVTKGDRKLIAYTENGEAGNFTNQLTLQVASIEEARLLEAQVEAFVALAESEKSEDYSDYTFDQCAGILKDAVTDVVINQDAYEQKFELHPENELIFTYTVNSVSDGKKHDCTVNAGDLGKIPARFDTDKNSVFVELFVTGDRDLVMIKTEGEKTAYDDRLRIRASDIEAARHLAGVFARFNALAMEKMNSSAAFSSVADAEKFVLKNIGTVVVNTDTYDQSIEQNSDGECLYSFHFTDVSDDKRYDYEFNMKDVDVNKIQFETNKGEALVTIQIKGGNDLVQTFENGEASKFTDSFRIKATDVEQARKLEAGLKMLAETCNEK